MICFQYDFITKHQTVKTTKSKIKIMLIVFSIHGVVHREFILKTMVCFIEL